jgi:peptidoglycan/xylan/chitin deacetylase (PgdA/CDA1 family)
MRIPGLGRLRRAARRWRGAPAAPLILMYHRAAEDDLDPWGLCVAPRHFAAHLDVLRARGPVVALSDVARGNGTVPEKATVVTFDDGYEDTLTVAAPLLEEHGVPATVFVTTAGFDGDGACWWDVLAELLLRPGQLPDHLSLRAGVGGDRWALGDHAAYGAEEAASHRGWRAEQPPPTVRHALFLYLWQRLIGLSHQEQRRVLDDLRAWAGRDGAPPGRLLTREEAARLSACEPLTIGAHTVHHPALPTLDELAQTFEIEGSKQQLEAVAARPVAHFAYPYGRYGPGVAARVRAAGFASAATTDPGRVRPDSDRFALPRVQVPDLDGPAFARWLDAR